MRRTRKLPVILSPQEMATVIQATSNLKHKAMISTMYSSGLRVSEMTHLHYDDISRKNCSIHVRDSKNRWDRYTILSQKNLELLTQYWYQCGRPKGILFPSSSTGSYLTTDGVNQFFQSQCKKSRDPEKRYLPIPAATALPAICWKQVLTCVIFRHCSGIKIPVQPNSIFM